MFEKKVQAEAVDEVLITIAEKNRDVLALSADMADRIIPGFARKYKNRFINCGITEQAMIGVAAGLAKSGFVPFVTTLAAFLSLRSCEQIRTDIAYAHSNVKIIASGGGLVYGTLGATHQGLEDLSVMKSITNLVVMAPADYEETVQAMLAAYDFPGPVYMRLGRGAVPSIHNKLDPKDFRIGKAIKISDGSDISILATGVMVAKAIEAGLMLKDKGVNAAIYSLHTVKPLDIGAVIEASSSKYGVITVEDNNLSGGLGEAVSGIITANRPVSVRSIGIPNVYPVIGDPEELYRYYNMDQKSIFNCAMELIKNHGKK